MFKQSDEKTEIFFEEYGISETKEEKEMLMTGFERAKYEEGLEKGRKEGLEKGINKGLEKGTTKTKEEVRINLINLFREENKTDEEINERLVKLGLDPI